jgi:hypothetical protein
MSALLRRKRNESRPCSRSRSRGSTMSAVVKTTKTTERGIATVRGTTPLCPPAAAAARTLPSSRTKASTIQCQRLEEAEAEAGARASEVVEVLQVDEVAHAVEPWRRVVVPPPPGNEKKRWP